MCGEAEEYPSGSEYLPGGMRRYHIDAFSSRQFADTAKDLEYRYVYEVCIKDKCQKEAILILAYNYIRLNLDKETAEEIFEAHDDSDGPKRNLSQAAKRRVRDIDLDGLEFPNEEENDYDDD